MQIQAKSIKLTKIYMPQYERQLLSAKAEQQYINELLTLGLIRKMLEREMRCNKDNKQLFNI